MRGNGDSIQQFSIYSGIRQIAHTFTFFHGTVVMRKKGCIFEMARSYKIEVESLQLQIEMILLLMGY